MNEHEHNLFKLELTRALLVYKLDSYMAQLELSLYRVQFEFNLF